MSASDELVEQVGRHVGLPHGLGPRRLVDLGLVEPEELGHLGHLGEGPHPVADLGRQRGDRGDRLGLARRQERHGPLDELRHA